ncbi:MAG: hypothetical protein K0R55_2459 [Sporomusa sp.]|jgi:polyhydroxyalkanoate synthesis regulator phasin|nr:hypothetical protein [Sporomusa sp.]
MKKVCAILGVTVVAVGIAVAVAMAAIPNDSCGTKMDSQHPFLMDRMVKDGIISAEQAKVMQNRMAETLSQHMNRIAGTMNPMMGSMLGGSCHGSKPSKEI